MAKFGPLKCLFHEVGEPAVVGQPGNTIKVQKIMFIVPGYVDGYGEKKGEDEPWVMDVIGTDIEKFNLTKDHEGKKVQIMFYMKGFAKAATDSSKAYSGYQVKLAEFKLQD